MQVSGHSACERHIRRTAEAKAQSGVSGASGDVSALSTAAREQLETCGGLLSCLKGFVNLDK